MKDEKLSDIEKRVKRNNIRFQSKTDEIVKEIKGKNLKNGRVRPKDPIEEKILRGFKRK